MLAKLTYLKEKRSVCDRECFADKGKSVIKRIGPPRRVPSLAGLSRRPGLAVDESQVQSGSTTPREHTSASLHFFFFFFLFLEQNRMRRELNIFCLSDTASP